MVFLKDPILYKRFIVYMDYGIKKYDIDADYVSKSDELNNPGCYFYKDIKDARRKLGKLNTELNFLSL